MAEPAEPTKRSEFADVLRQTVAQLDSLPDGERHRWRQLLWYAHALVYHKRVGEERDRCAEYIRETVQAAHHEEVEEMVKTIRDVILEEGMEKGQLLAKRDSLSLLLLKKFKSIPEDIKSLIAATEDRQILEAWFRETLDADKLEDISFGA